MRRKGGCNTYDSKHKAHYTCHLGAQPIFIIVIILVCFTSALFPLTCFGRPITWTNSALLGVICAPLNIFDTTAMGRFSPSQVFFLIGLVFCTLWIPYHGIVFNCPTIPNRDSAIQDTLMSSMKGPGHVLYQRQLILFIGGLFPIVCLSPSFQWLQEVRGA
ncbi:hypothetical protein BKA70DRAFT_1275199 [Coprinopsis sp. MPI-PUGE-AT-0042]|nr:hypothetical protein BKA70DRAFT_1275199 [Coprinopsis sp. MPI-PUGE-AT-0042]